MTNAFDFVYSCISGVVAWLGSVSLLGVSILVWLIALTIVGIIIDRVF